MCSLEKYDARSDAAVSNFSYHSLMKRGTEKPMPEWSIKGETYHGTHYVAAVYAALSANGR